MLAVQRHRRILSLAESDGCVRVADLARELEVTEETIRRDLKKLDEQGKLVRIHGGAVLVSEGPRETTIASRSPVNAEEKRAIAARALRHVDSGDVIALDASSTSVELARQLPDVELTVITNSLSVVRSLVNHHNVRVVSTGGNLDRATMSYVGPVAEQSLARYNIAKLFLSPRGVDFKRGLSVANESHARLKETLVKATEQVILLVDHSKFGVRGVEFFAPLSSVAHVITDRGVTPQHEHEFHVRGISLEVAS